jgi:hypothetical protein
MFEMQSAKIIRPSLHDWFVSYAQARVWKEHCHLPGLIDIDVTRIARAFEPGERVPYVVFVIRALALAAEKNPAINRLFFNTLTGSRVLQLSRADVSMPVHYVAGGRTYIKQVRFFGAASLSTDEIREKIRQAKQDTKPPRILGPLNLGSANHFVNRTLLRVLYFLLSRFPSLYAKAGGTALAVTSVTTVTGGGFQPRLVAYGAGAATLCISGVEDLPDGRTILHLGFGWDHQACRADEALPAMREIQRLLESDELVDGAGERPSVRFAQTKDRDISRREWSSMSS